MNLENQSMSILASTMGKLFKICYIAKTEKEANDYCEKHRDCAVIEEYRGLIFIAEKEETKPASLK
jgi:hypothetical protein